MAMPSSGLHHSFSLSDQYSLHHAAAGDTLMADSIPLITVLSGMMAVPCIIILAQGSEKVTKTFAVAGALVSLWLGLFPYVNFLKDITNGTLFDVLGILALLLAVIIAIRFKHHVMGTVMITAGALIALKVLGIVH
jgi:hypothetical protein